MTAQAAVSGRRAGRLAPAAPAAHRFEREDDRRSLEFARARRHSRRVAVLKLLLPGAALGILSLYALPALLSVSIDNGRGTASVRAITVTAGSLKMLEPHVRGVNAQLDAYDFTADTATQASRNADVMFLDKVRGRMTGHDGKITTLTAPDSIHDNKADTMTFEHGALVVREPGMSATFRTATAFMKQQRMEATTPVLVRMYESTINADSMVLYWAEQRAIFTGHVKTHIERQPQPSAVADAKPAEPPAASRSWAAGVAVSVNDKGGR